MAEQLSFDLPTRPALGRGDYYVSPANAPVLKALDGWRGWPAARLVVVGPEGSGKSHLASVFAAETSGKVIKPAELAGDLGDLAQSPLAIDDADEVRDETALFHLLNMMAQNDQPLLLTAQSAPGRWPIDLPDLASRLGAIQIARLGEPDDALLAAVLVKNFSDRGLVPPASLVPYLVTHMERTFRAARRMAEELDRRALAERRPLGQKLAREILDNWAQDDA